jgi:hypothetical protein
MFTVYGRRPNGQVLILFHWTRDEASGIARAWREAKDFNVQLTEIWAVPQ